MTNLPKYGMYAHCSSFIIDLICLQLMCQLGKDVRKISAGCNFDRISVEITFANNSGVNLFESFKFKMLLVINLTK